MLAPYLPRDGVAVDAGAHAGQMTRMFASLCPQGRVYAFEPASYARSILTLALNARGVRNVTVESVALGDSDGAVTLATPLKRKHRSMAYGLTHVNGAPTDNQFAETVRAATLDSYVAANAVARIDLIKIDVEGWEGRVLAGAVRTLAQFRPTVMIELNPEHLARAGDDAGAVFAQLRAAGYAAERLSGVTGAERTPAIAFEGPGDYLFTPV